MFSIGNSSFLALSTDKALAERLRELIKTLEAISGVSVKEIREEMTILKGFE